MFAISIFSFVFCRGPGGRLRDPRLCSRDPRDPRTRPDPRTGPRPPEPPVRGSDPRDPRGSLRGHDTDSRVPPHRPHEPTLIPQEPRTNPRAVPLIPETLLPLEPRDPRKLLGDVDLRQLPESDTDLRKKVCDTDLRSIDLTSSSSDVDLRDVSLLGLPFKPLPPHTPAKEIDASLNSHPPLPYKLVPITVPRPDYTNLKIARTDPQVKNDPRLRKIFKLSTNEPSSKNSPRSSSSSSSPSASSSSNSVRVDPRTMRSPDHVTEAPRGDPRKNRRTSDPDPRLSRPDPRAHSGSSPPSYAAQTGPLHPPSDPRLLKRQDSLPSPRVDPRMSGSRHPSGPQFSSYPPQTPRVSFDDSDSDEENSKNQWGRIQPHNMKGGNLWGGPGDMPMQTEPPMDGGMNPWGFFPGPKNEPPFGDDVRWNMMN